MVVAFPFSRSRRWLRRDRRRRKKLDCEVHSAASKARSFSAPPSPSAVSIRRLRGLPQRRAVAQDRAAAFGEHHRRLTMIVAGTHLDQPHPAQNLDVAPNRRAIERSEPSELGKRQLPPRSILRSRLNWARPIPAGASASS